MKKVRVCAWLLSAVWLAFPLEATMESAQPISLRPSRSLFAPGEPVRIQVTLPAELSQPVKVLGELLDSRGRRLTSAEPLSVSDPRKQGSTVVELPPQQLPRNEWLRARVTVIYGQYRVSGEVGVLVRPRPTDFGTEAPSPFALLVGHPYTKRWLGARWQRPNFNWNEREHELARRYGVTTLAMINQATSALHGRMSVEEYARFVEDSVRKFKGMIRWWQLGNEPPLFQPGMAERYVEVLKAGYQAAKRADPNCVVVMAGLTGLNVDPNMLARFLDAGGAKWCDVIDLHLYVDIPTMDRLLTKVRGDMVARSVAKPIILTEVTANAGKIIPEREKAGHVYKRYAIALSHGVKQLYWFVMHWVNDLPGGHQNCGLINVKDHAPWPAAAAYARLADALTGATFERRIITDDGAWLFEFRKDARHIWVLWAEDGEPRPVRIPCGEGTARLIDVAGHEWSVSVAQGLTVTLTAEPLLLELPASATAGNIAPSSQHFRPAQVTLSRGETTRLELAGVPRSHVEFDVPPGLKIEQAMLHATPNLPPRATTVWAFIRKGQTTTAALRLPVAVSR